MRTPFLLAIVAACAFAASAHAERASFVGPGSRPETARIESSTHGTRDVRRGEVVEGLGELKEIGEDEAVFERIPDDAERARLADLGAAIPDVVRFHLRRASDANQENGVAFVSE